jgi:hypothetical protein
MQMTKKMHHNSISVATIALLLGGMIIAATEEVQGQAEEGDVSSSPSLQTSFLTDQPLENCNFASIGKNDYFILEPGNQVILEGEEDGEKLQLIMSVMNETKIVDGVETRVVEEKETEGGNLIEVSRNYFAMCKPTNNAIYFGEDVKLYAPGIGLIQDEALKLVKHTLPS